MSLFCVVYMFWLCKYSKRKRIQNTASDSVIVLYYQEKREMETNFTFNKDIVIAAAVVLSVEMILALIANGIVLLITITQRKSWKQSSTIFFTSLILAHFVMNILYLPFTIIALAAGEWIFGSTNKEKRGTCNFSFFIYNGTVLVISMTLAAISFDRFLFIIKPHLHKRFMRPWVALTLTIAIWILSAVMSVINLYGFNRQYNLDLCFTASSSSIGFVIYFILVSVTVVGIIFITSVWTFCFTCFFINNQSVTAGESAYASRKKRLFGIFGSMLIVYIVCFIPGFLYFSLELFFEVPVEGDIVTTLCFLFITIANPIVQAYFRPEIRRILLSRCPCLSSYVCCSCTHSIC